MSVFRPTEEWLAQRKAAMGKAIDKDVKRLWDEAGVAAAKAFIDTSGVALPQAAGKYPPVAERDVLGAILEWLPYCKAVAWFARMNTGAQVVGDRYIRFGFKGCPDIIGQLRDGRFLGIEVKRPGAEPTEAQVEFLSKVQRHRGVAFVAHSLEDVQTSFAVMAKGK